MMFFILLTYFALFVLFALCTGQYRSQPLPPQQLQQQQAPPSLPSSLPGYNNPFNTPTIPSNNHPSNSNADGADGDVPRSLSYLDFNEYQ